ncbi:hypothetical protein BDF20DRAFT_850272 [Mycotypha africana]|uniref:uncharacterized protein n=1 Tax=Mycotypha africana TaxID=64632 RepID=UPI00230178D9|nr:uncharacterized protein BDF20DRAFT_850272 [Mycotypha africana]KAI8987431.1 hypothetical protein BDF20DRAFT_850272 [Mycotypha africana]
MKHKSLHQQLISLSKHCLDQSVKTVFCWHLILNSISWSLYFLVPTITYILETSIRRIIYEITFAAIITVITLSIHPTVFS